MRISYCFPPSPRLASYRYRIQIPALELQKLGHECVHGLEGDVVVFSKHFNAEDYETARSCKGKTVFDWCDDHRGTRWAQHYRLMASACEAVTCPTETMRDIIYQQTGREATVISDPYEFGEAPPVPPGKILFWFGHQSNLHTLKDVDLKGYDLRVLTGGDWSLERMLEGFASTDIVIIPTNATKQYKSPNRMVESIRQGHYVVAGPMPAYEGYGMWIGDIREGLEWACSHPDEVREAILQGQDTVRQKHSPQTIGAKWECLLKSL